MKRWLLIALAVLGAAPAWGRDAVITNLTVSPSSAANTSVITVSFDIAAGSGGGGDTTRFAVGFADSAYSYNCNTTNQINWVADENGIYNGTTWWLGAVTKTATAMGYTDVVGPNGGLTGGTGTTAQHVSIPVTIPPEFSGNYQVLVIGNRDGMGVQSTTCGSCVTGATSLASTGFTATGSPLVKLNLEVCNAGTCTTGAICWQYRVTNWGQSGVRVTGLDMKFCFYDTNYNWEAQGSSNAQGYLPSGASYCNTYNPSEQYSFNNFSTVDCGSDGKANQCYNYTIKGGPINQSMPYFVPPNGGYLESKSPPIWFRPIPNVLPTVTDDYSNLTNAPACGSGWSSLPRVALYNGGSLVCEWSSSSANDQNTGVPYCGSTGGCNNCPTGAVANMARNGTGPSNVVCLAIYSPTPTPVMQLTKVADRTTGLVGDTITYTISWVNNASAARTMVIWDTVPSNTTYVGCNNSCSVSGNVVTWNLGSQASGASGSVKFWVVVSALPYLPDWLQQRQALAPPAPRSRELLLGLWAPLSAPRGQRPRQQMQSLF